MFAEAGEIVDEWIERDEKDMETILSKNGHKEKYWVVLFENVIPGKNIRFQGRTPIVRVLKDYDTQPKPLVGAHIAEVDNLRGKIIWRSYPKDIPVDWSQITDQEMVSKQLIYECDIPNAYIYNKPK
jgi:hypothetical protein